MSSDNHNQLSRNNIDRRSFLSRLGLGAAGTAAYAGAAHAKEESAPAANITPDQRELQERAARNRAARAIKKRAKPNALNLVFVCADTLRLDHVGAYGLTRAKTPCLDELAKQSVVFENAFTIPVSK